MTNNQTLQKALSVRNAAMLLQQAIESIKEIKESPAALAIVSDSIPDLQESVKKLGELIST